MTQLEKHPSYFELDLAALERGAPETVAHLQQCQACSAHFARVRQPSPIPDWLPNQTTRFPWFGNPLWTSLSLAGGLALVALVALPNLRRDQRTEEIAVRSKGGPAVEVYVKRGDEARLWQRGDPLHPGDRIRFRVAAAGFARVTLAAKESGSIRELTSEKLSGPEPILLGESFRLDANPASEQLWFVFSQRALNEQELQSAVALRDPTPNIWTIRIELPKQSTRDSDRHEEELPK